VHLGARTLAPGSTICSGHRPYAIWTTTARLARPVTTDCLPRPDPGSRRQFPRIEAQMQRAAELAYGEIRCEQERQR
jgi:hypothetical protein